MAHPVSMYLNMPGSVPTWTELDVAGRRAMLMEILARVSSEALQGETLEAVLQQIVDCIARSLPVTIASIILLDEAGEYFVQEVWSGKLALYLPGGLPWPIAIGASGRCVRTGEAQLIDNVHGDADYVPGNVDVKSEYIVPIRHRDRLHGVLNLESTSAGLFTGEVCSAFDAIARQIAGAIHYARVVRDLEIANRRLRQLSMSDGLTGIANRRCFDERIALEWSRHAERGCSLALLLVDVDCFKPLNDARGHLHGDECLRVLAGVCIDVLRGQDDLVARYGGEEFALLLPDCDLRGARRMAERLRRNIEALALPHPTSPVEPHVTVSVGVSAVVPPSAQSSNALIAAADRALYIGKARGRNRVVARIVAGDEFNTGNG